MNNLIQAHGSYRKLKTFQLARLIYDLTVRFCKAFVSPYSRTTDQMIQAARSGVQNIAEGSEASATSRKTEIKLTNVAKASLEELLCDYEDFLRQHDFILWQIDNPLRKEIIRCSFTEPNQVARWVKGHHEKTKCPIREISANVLLTLISMTCTLLKRQINAQCKAFEEQGGFTERLYQARVQQRSSKWQKS